MIHMIPVHQVTSEVIKKKHIFFYFLLKIVAVI